MHYVRSIAGVLPDHLGWHRARLKFMARFPSALLKLTTTNLRQIAVALKAGVQQEVLRRFFDIGDPETVEPGKKGEPPPSQ